VPYPRGTGAILGKRYQALSRAIEDFEFDTALAILKS
jgi:hypothetical protein